MGGGDFQRDRLHPNMVQSHTVGDLKSHEIR